MSLIWVGFDEVFSYLFDVIFLLILCFKFKKGYWGRNCLVSYQENIILKYFQYCRIQQDNLVIREGLYSLYFNFSLNEIHPTHKAHEQIHFQLTPKEISNPLSEISTNFFFFFSI